MSEDVETDIDREMREEVTGGMQQEQKQISSKFLYDEAGSALFDQITKLEAYYPTRTEWSIMLNNSEEITRVLGERVQLVEFGSGSSVKTRLLLEEMDDLASYIPIDISEEHLQKTADSLRTDFPNLEIKPLCADYTQPLTLPECEEAFDKRVIYFPGSTIGNFRPSRASEFLKMAGELAGPDGGLLIGVDLKKDREVLRLAYNDPEGVTAAFNLNLLTHLNRELDADFNRGQFEHKAIFNEEEGRIEMHLVSLTEQRVTIGEEVFHLAKGETIHTENSYKYTLEEFTEIASPAFEPLHIWTDDRNYFSVQYLTVT